MVAGFFGRLAAVALALCGAWGAGVAAPFSDNFRTDSGLNAGWTLAEPNAASTYSLGKKGLLLDASGQNGGSDLWPFTNYDASLLLQPIDAKLNWTITVKVPFQITNNYMGAGIVLTTQTGGFTSSSAFHRFEYGDNPQPGLESFTNGTRDPAYVAFTGPVAWLRVHKSGTTYSYSYSTNGKAYTAISTLSDATAFTYVGLISIRQPYDGQTGVDAKPVFPFFAIKVTKH